MGTPEVSLSVICPSYNRAPFLEECIAPVMAVPDAEFILVDDGSTDGTLELARAIQERYGKDRIVVIPLGGNQGAQVARNRGMEQARGEMILFCDSDDVLVSSGVNELVEALSQNPDLDYAYGQVVMTDEHLKPLDGVSAIGSSFHDSPFEMAGYHWHTMGPLYRKSFLERVGPWNPDLSGSQDWEYQARVKLAGGKGLFVDTLVGYWRQHEEGRVGARKFRPDYVRSVVTACGVILSTAKNYQKCDKLIERRITKILFLHALEWGEYGFSSERANVLYAASNALSEDSLFKYIILLFSYTPKFLDKYVRIILKLGNRMKNNGK